MSNFSNADDYRQQLQYSETIRKGELARHTAECTSPKAFALYSDEHLYIGICQGCGSLIRLRNFPKSLEQDLSQVVLRNRWAEYFADEFSGLPVNQGGQV